MMEKYSFAFYILIPVLVVMLCRIFEAAQGERNEEIVFGFMCGLVVDLTCYAVRRAVRRKWRSGD